MRCSALVAVVAALAFAQTYRCDWSVVAQGGGVYFCRLVAGDASQAEKPALQR
jgi:hypothetical protein